MLGGIIPVVKIPTDTPSEQSPTMRLVIPLSITMVYFPTNHTSHTGTKLTDTLLGYDEKTVWGPFETILPIVSGISIFLSILTIAAYFLIRKYMPQVANRVSLRLVALIALADIAYNSTWFSMEFYFTEYVWMSLLGYWVRWYITH